MSNHYTDIAIIGGGLVGIIQAIALARNNFNVVIIDKTDITNKTKSHKIPDNRSIAITAASMDYLDSLELWQDLSNQANKIEHIIVSESYKPHSLNFDSELLDGNPMGYIINAHTLLHILTKQLLKYNIKIIQAIIHNATNESNHIDITLDNGDIYHSKLLLAADGKQSTTRDIAKIGTKIWDYEQTASIFTVKHELHHNNTAREDFYPAGAFATLPQISGYQSGIVWMTSESSAEFIKNSNIEDIYPYINERFGDYWGKFSIIDGPIQHKIKAILANQYIRERIALIGDAAHTIHPLAGLGLNAGIADIKYITNLICHYNNLGLDYGKITCLEQYDKHRRKENHQLFSLLHFTDKIFSNNSYLLSFLRSSGYSIIDAINPMKKNLMKYAIGYNVR